MNDLNKLIEAAQAITAVTDRYENSIPVFMMVDKLENARDAYPGDQIIAHMAEAYKTLQREQPHSMVSKDHVQNCFNHFAGFGTHDNVRTVLANILVDHRQDLGAVNRDESRSWGDDTTRNIEDVTAGKQALEVSANALELDLSKEGTYLEDDQGDLATHAANLLLRANSRFSDDQINAALNCVASEFTQVVGQSPSVRFISDTSDGLKIIATLSNGRVDKDFTVDVSLGSDGAPMPLYEYAVANGASRVFTAANINKDLNTNSESDRLVINPEYLNLNFGELMQEMYLASAEGDLGRCKQVLAVVNDKYPEQAKVAVNEYMDGLETSSRTQQATCSKVIRNNTSVQDICGHMLIPVSQIVVDAQGHCRRKSLAAFDAVEREGVNISTSKVKLT